MVRRHNRRNAPRWTAEEWTAANFTLYVRSGGRCERCGGNLSRLGVERHHRMRKRDGGDRLANIVLLCPACHIPFCHAFPDAARDSGHVVATWDDVLTAPILIGGIWYTLDDAGGRTTFDQSGDLGVYT